MKRIAYCVVPEPGGLYSFYCNIRKSLLKYRWEVFAVCIGPSASARWNSDMADENCILLSPDEPIPLNQAKAFSNWIEEKRINIVIPMDDTIAASSVPHLSSRVRLVTRCSSSTSFAYRICFIYPERLGRIIVMTPRQKAGFSRFKKLPKEKIIMIPHGCDIAESNQNIRKRSHHDEILNIAYVGRLDNKTKGVLWLPKIFSKIVKKNPNMSFHIVGDGMDKPKLKEKLQRRNIIDHVKFHGSYKVEKVRDLMDIFDFLVLPSLVEGFPNVMLEAMARGVVPVVSRLKGVTDFIIEDGVSGYLCKIGKTDEFADKINDLILDRKLLKKSSIAAIDRVRKHFTLERNGRNYDNVFNKLLSEPRPNVLPRSWHEFKLASEFQPKWRSWIPDIIKDFGRSLRTLET